MKKFSARNVKVFFATLPADRSKVTLTRHVRNSHGLKRACILRRNFCKQAADTPSFKIAQRSLLFVVSYIVVCANITLSPFASSIYGHNL